MTDMCTRLEQKKTDSDILQSDIISCHKLKDNDHAYILSVANRLPGSGWKTLTAGMVTGKMKNSQEYFKKDQIRLVRKKGIISKFSVNV